MGAGDFEKITTLHISLSEPESLGFGLSRGRDVGDGSVIWNWVPTAVRSRRATAMKKSFVLFLEGNVNYEVYLYLAWLRKAIELFFVKPACIFTQL